MIWFELFELFAEFTPGPHGGDLDFGFSPAGEIADILHRIFLEVEETDHDLLAGLEGGDQTVEELANGGQAFLIVGRLSCEILFDYFRLGFAEVGIADKRAGLVLTEPVIAGVDGDSRDPMGEGLFAGELLELQENLGEGLLRQIIVIGGLADLIPDNFGDVGIKKVNEFTPRFFFTRPHADKKLRGDGDGIGHLKEEGGGLEEEGSASANSWHTVLPREPKPAKAIE